VGELSGVEVKRKVGRKPTPQQAATRPALPEVPDTVADADDSSERIVMRPDGYHWLARDGRQEFGPFDTFDDALADMLATGPDDLSGPGADLHEAEDEIGIADWIDPDTGEPAEGQSTPHLQED
jgi:hypothetical protein